MFGTIRKHSKWLWLVIITLTIISFVVFFSPYSKVNDGTGSGDFGTVSGKKVTRSDYRNARAEVLLRYLFMTGSFPNEEARRRGYDEQREIYQWLFLTRKQEELGIEVSPEVAARTAREMLGLFERQGAGSPTAFAKQVLEREGLNLQDFERYVRHYVGLQQLISVVGASGKLVTPQEAREIYIRENQPVNASVVVFSASNYLSKVNPTPDEVARFYTNNMASYRLPDRVQIAYVKFPVSNYMAKAESELSRSNLNEMVEANMQRLGTNLFGGAKSPQESRLKIREEIIRSMAMSDARRQANSFAHKLFDNEKSQIQQLFDLAKQENLQVSTTAPFDRENGPQDIQVGPEFVNAAFSRTPEDPFGQPYVVPGEGVYVYGLAKIIPSQMQPLEQIRKQVETDFKLLNAASLARQEGIIFANSVTNSLAKGQSFAEAAKSKGLKVIDLPPFSISTRSLPGDIEESVPLNQLKELAFTTPEGKASEFQPTREGGIVLFVKSKMPVDEKKMAEELATFTGYLQRARTDEAFQAWFRKEGEKGLRNIALDREQAPGRS